MSRPYKEVIFYNKVSISKESDGTAGRLGLSDLNGARLGAGANNIFRLWRGSINDFISDFELPSDFKNYWRNNSNDTTGSAIEIVENYFNTINFKVNLEFWYRLSNEANNTNFGPCANVTFDITLPNFISYNAAVVGYPNMDNFKPYNPNIFPILFANSPFSTSNKELASYNGTTWGLINNATPFLFFRYNVDGNDIQICMASVGHSGWQQNNSSIYLARASLTFLGFNTTKKVSRG